MIKINNSVNHKIYNNRFPLRAMGLLREIFLLIIFIGLLVGSYFAYSFYLSDESQKLGAIIPGKAPKIDLENVSPNVVQFYENMRFNHNRISYFINENCNLEKQEKFREAFSLISEKVPVLSFRPVSEDAADILVGCSADSYQKEENIFVAGEGGPTKIINTSMPVILRGKVLLYNEERSKCEAPILEIHELLHVFGYDHINNKDNIMYPYLDCDQKLNPDLVNHMNQLYSIEPFAELSFEKLEANKQRSGGKWYLNFNVSIKNDGIINAQQVSLIIKIEDKIIKEFELNDLELGGGKNFFVNNLAISDTDEIKFVLETITNEQDTKNNLLVLNVQ